MRKVLAFLAFVLLTNNIYSQAIINSLTKQAFDAADKQLYNLINKVKKNKNNAPADTTSANTDNSSTTSTNTDTWDCQACGTKGNTGNFCKECGVKKPEPIVPWKCPKCGREGNEGKFCTQCGEKKPEEWTCPDCGKANTGNFCTDCGAKKPTNEAVAAKDYNQYIASLAPTGAENWKLELNLYKDETPSSTLTFSNYQDAINGILELPTAKLIVDSDSLESWKLQQQNVEAALSIMTNKYSNTAIELQSAQKSEGTSAEPKLNVTQEDKIEALKQASIDTAQATEAHIQAALIPYLSKKWDIPEKDVDKIMKLSQADEDVAVSYIKEKYPDKSSVLSNSERNKEKYIAISDSLQQLSKEIEAHSGTTLEEELKVLAEQISPSWTSSEEAQNVIELETALDNMMSKFKNKDNLKPTFWIEARKAENTVIMSWNMQQAIKWRKVIQNHLEIYKGYAARLASFENQLEVIRDGKEIDEQYVKAKTQCLGMVSVIVKYVTMPAAVLSVPLAKYTPEN